MTATRECKSITFLNIAPLSLFISVIVPHWFNELLLRRSGMFSLTISASILHTFPTIQAEKMTLLMTETCSPSPKVNFVSLGKKFVFNGIFS